ncbi:ParA family protein [Halomonas marinisediminis]|uniref:ParA family protein n=1 Tax=Halomonas marinisediminis TaxID=2546095 RepID=A0ABY2D8L9_9GAMM|nr:ParA family protein [Halomonas marinisediminis]TDB02088.1 ParA family protein [Halomonas marinisediminis]
MRVVSVVSTKGGVGKTTVTANLGGLLADAGLKVLFIDLDSQPTLSSYYPLRTEAPGGTYELIALSDTAPDRVISQTAHPNLDVVISNDHAGQLPQLLLNAPDGRFRLAQLLSSMLDYDLLLIDTQGARSITLEMAVLASDHALSPITPELLSAREFVRGTVGLLRDLEALSQFTHLSVPPVSVLVNRLDETADARGIHQTLAEMFAAGDQGVTVMQSTIRAGVAFRQAASAGLPAHQFEPRKPAGRKSPAAADQVKLMACELNADWQRLIDAMVITTTMLGGCHDECH